MGILVFQFMMTFFPTIFDNYFKMKVLSLSTKVSPLQINTLSFYEYCIDIFVNCYNNCKEYIFFQPIMISINN